MKIFVLKPEEDWIVDKIGVEFEQHTEHEIVEDPKDADVVWILSPWIWHKIPITILQEKYVVCSIHHIDPDKFDHRDFMQRDEFVNEYWTYDPYAYAVISKLINDEKKLILTNYWCNKDEFYRLPDDKNALREKHGIPEDAFVIGSFQRDTEGFDLKSPKLSKGPDRLASIFKSLKDSELDLHVVLAGWRRQYIVGQLEEMEIPYTYLEKTDITTLNELYNLLDIYLVTSRHEGGPQSIYEAGLVRCPILSTKVGSATRILHTYSLCNNVEDMLGRMEHLDGGDIARMVHENYKSVLKHDINEHIKVYNKMFGEIYADIL